MGQQKQRMTIYVSVDLYKAIHHEAVERNMTMSDLVEEAFANRAVLIRKPAKEVKP
jgi:hypothetical protein